MKSKMFVACMATVLGLAAVSVQAHDDPTCGGRGDDAEGGEPEEDRRIRIA